jgi:potassium channel subfamily K
MATAFSICALVQNWREYIPEGGTEAHGDAIKDPKWWVSLLLSCIHGKANRIFSGS